MSERERSVTLNKGHVPLWLPAGPEKGKEQKRVRGTSVEVAFSSLPVFSPPAGCWYTYPYIRRWEWNFGAISNQGKEITRLARSEEGTYWGRKYYFPLVASFSCVDMR